MAILREGFLLYAGPVYGIFLECQRSHCQYRWWTQRGEPRSLSTRTMDSGAFLIKIGQLWVHRNRTVLSVCFESPSPLIRSQLIMFFFCQGALGPLKSCEVNPGKIYILFGGFVLGKGTVWQPKSTSVRDWRQGLENTRQWKGIELYEYLWQTFSGVSLHIISGILGWIADL